MLTRYSVSVQVSDKAVSGLKGLVQRLAQERVSLSAVTANAEADVSAAAAKLDGALTELNGLMNMLPVSLS